MQGQEQAAAPPEPAKPEERIAASLRTIANALIFIGVMLAMSECRATMPGKDDGARALSGIEYQLQLIHEDLGKNQTENPQGATEALQAIHQDLVHLGQPSDGVQDRFSPASSAAQALWDIDTTIRNKRCR